MILSKSLGNIRSPHPFFRNPSNPIPRISINSKKRNPRKLKTEKKSQKDFNENQIDNEIPSKVPSANPT